MRSKKSKTQKSSPPKLLAERISSEQALSALASRFARELLAGDVVFLEGPMGVGKTTFARELLLALGVAQPPEGSPSFSIAHEYHSKGVSVVHLDLYRLKSDEELEEVGIPEYFEDPTRFVFVEWASQFPLFVEKILSRAGKRHWRASLSFCSPDPEQREITIRPLWSPL